MSQTIAGRRGGEADRAPRPTRDQRAARGRAARAEVPRSSHAEFRPAPDRPDPIGLLERQATSRVPELLPIRYGRMAVSPFTYFRGAALPMASDLARTPRSGLVVQACGDAHLSNFGLFASPERRLVFDINDFDETQPGPWEWDVKRLATSMEIAGRDNGYADTERRDVVLATVAAYRGAMREFATRTTLDVWYARADASEVESIVGVRLRGRQGRKLARGVAKAQTRDNLGALGRFASVRDGRPRILPEPPLIVPVADVVADPTRAEAIEQQLRDLVRVYRDTLEPDRRVLLDQYQLVDMARKVVGVGSVGTRSWMLLLIGHDTRDPLFLQAKEADSSVLADFIGPSEYENAGRRVVVGQRLMQSVSDIFLGWLRAQGFDGQNRDFYLRQLRDWKGSAEVEAMVPTGMRAYGQLCGWTLAKAHARTGDRVAIAAYLGSGRAFDQAIAAFASSYADQNERDHQALLDAIGSGRITASPGV